MAPGSILTPSLHLRWVGKFGGTQRIESQSPSFALVSHTSAGIALILLSVNEDESSSEINRWWSHCTQSTPSSSFSTPQGCERRHTHEDKLEHNMLGCTQTKQQNTEHSWKAHRQKAHWQRWSALCSFTNFSGFTDFSNFAFRTNLWTAGDKVSSYWSRGKKNSEIYLTFCYETCNPLKQCAHFTETHSFSYTANVTGGWKKTAA